MDTSGFLGGGLQYAVGHTEVFTMANATGVERVRTVGDGYWERVISIVFNFTTDATANARIVKLEWEDQDQNRFARGIPPATQAASLGYTYIGGIGIPAIGPVSPPGFNQVTIPMHSIYLSPGWGFRIAVNNLGAGDIIASARGLVERLPLGPQGYPVGRPTQGETQTAFTRPAPRRRAR